MSKRSTEAIEHRRTELQQANRRLMAMRVIPDGANDPLIPVPNEVEIDPENRDEVNLWDKHMKRFAGMLEARVIKRQGLNELDLGRFIKNISKRFRQIWSK